LSKNKTKVHVGFAVETKDEYNASLKKLNQKNLDFIVLNNPKHQGAAFQSDTNVVTVIDKEGNIEKYPLQSKLSVADKVLDKILKYL
jgi:phosphopantothenoylcysteine decarboxylase/phosphopantothenate--cysteine ligase